MNLQSHEPSGRGLLVCSCLGLLLPFLGCTDNRTSGPRPNVKAVSLIREAISDESAAQGPTESATAATPTGWATLTGKFQLVGAAPTNPPLNVSGSDAEVCSPSGKKVLAEDVTVGADGALKNVVIYLDTEISDAEPWTHPEAKAGQGGDVVFDQKECIFLTHVVGMRVGQRMSIKNSDPIGHNTNIQSKSGAPFNQTIPVGATVNFSPTTVEQSPVNVNCSIHPHMKAFLVVRGNGYFAISKEDGTFEIPNLPAGVELEFRVWQEKAQFLNGVEIAGQTTKKGKFTMTLDPQDPSKNQIDVQLDAALFN